MKNRGLATGEPNHDKAALAITVRDASMSRRQLLLLAGAAGIGSLVPGCGGGAGGGGNGSGGTDVAARTVPTGTLANQLDQYSRLVDKLSLSYSGSSPL